MTSTSATRTFARRLAFVVDDLALRQLDEILAKVSDKRVFSVVLKGNISNEYESAESVLRIPNSKDREIRRLTINTPWGSTPRATISLIGDSDFDTVKYDISGDYKEIFIISSDLDEWISEVKPWYSRIATTDFIGFFFATLLIGIIGLFIFASIFAFVVIMSRGPSQPLAESPRTGWSVLFR